MGWLLILGLKECLVECATLCVKSEVMLMLEQEIGFSIVSCWEEFLTCTRG